MSAVVPNRSLLAIAALSFVAACSSNGRTTGNHFEISPDTRDELALGKHVYDTHCARCHGVDGKAEGYPFILTLDGIGKRYTLDQILEETWATGFVAPQQFTPEEQRAMAKYVATL